MLTEFIKLTPKSRIVKFKKARGILFSNPGGVKKLAFYFGTFFLIFSICYLLYLYIPIIAVIVRYQEKKRDETNISSELIVPTPTPFKELNASYEYTVSVPKILAFSKIVENVSPYNKEEYLKVLENDTVAQSKGSSIPGSGPGHTTYLFAHSTSQGLMMVRKNAVFYLLGELNIGDIVFINRHGINYTYRVTKSLVVNADRIEFLNYVEDDKELLIMQTCWPIGTDWKRLLVFAEKL